ncbi:MAG: DUF5522 domain-containing protein [Acidobacteriota bacterium]
MSEELDDAEARRLALAEFARLPLESGDFYMDGALMVFTEAYHQRRGFCCDSGCRHCPYGAGAGE